MASLGTNSYDATTLPTISAVWRTFRDGLDSDIVYLISSKADTTCSTTTCFGDNVGAVNPTRALE
jgi:hypothetical protein